MSAKIKELMWSGWPIMQMSCLVNDWKILRESSRQTLVCEKSNSCKIQGMSILSIHAACNETRSHPNSFHYVCRHCRWYPTQSINCFSWPSRHHWRIEGGVPGTRAPPGAQILSFSCSRGQNWKIIALLGVGAPSGENPRYMYTQQIRWQWW